jgi:uncharacterized protein YbjQ (UPF0145 family)
MADDPLPEGGTAAAGTFSGTLSASELALAADAGFEPAGFVMGSAVCHIGLPGSAAASSGIARAFTRPGELKMVSKAVRSAWEAATARLEDDARRLGADGVAGVQLTVGHAPWAHDAAEIIVTGTALRHGGARHSGDGTPAYQGPDGRPFVSGLSGQDLWTLLRSGHRPVGIVLGCYVYRAAADNWAPGAALGNRELSNLTTAVYTARELAMLRMQDEAGRMGASGIVGVRLDHLGWREHRRIVECRALGTAITPVPGAPEAEPPATVLPVG